MNKEERIKEEMKWKEPIIENAEKYADSVQIQNSSNVDPSASYITKLIPSVLDKLAIKHFVGIQPMVGPIGLVYTLEYKQSNENNPYDEDNEKPPHISLNIISSAIEASTRRLATSLTIESHEDLKDDTENMIFNTLTDEIAVEIYKEVKTGILQVANKKTYKMTDKAQSIDLMLPINYCANEIAVKTRRGAGNFIITSKNISKILKGDMEINEDLIDNDYGHIKYVGTLNDTMNVYCDKEMSYNEVVVGYKGSSSTDAGYIYCPYILLMGTGVLLDPKTFVPTIKLMTRGGKHIIQDSKTVKTADGNKVITTIETEPCNYYYHLTFEDLPKPKKAKIKVTESKPSVTENLFD